MTLVAKLELLVGLATSCSRWLVNSCCLAREGLGPAMSLGRQVMTCKSERGRDDEQLIKLRRVGKDTSGVGAADTAAWC